MRSEWKVYSVPIPTEKGYITRWGVYRLKDVDKINHSGNRETAGKLFDNYKDAEQLARLMNSKEGC